MIEKTKPQFRPKLRMPGTLEEILRTLIFVVVVTVLFDMAIPRSLVDGMSMQPTFHDGERLIVSRLHLLITPPDRGDVIVFNSTDVNEPETMLIKRVIGLPGETVTFRDQQVYINGVLLNEAYLDQDCRHCNNNEWVLGNDEYFVMGDNRNNSKDSRDSRIGPVPLNHFVGRVVFRYWPPEAINVIEHENYEPIP